MSHVAEYGNQASQTRYPFSERSSMTDVSGTSMVMDRDFLDISVVSPLPGERTFWISRIEVSPGSVSGILSCQSDPSFATFSSPPSGNVCPLIDRFGTRRGVVVLGRPPRMERVVPGGVDFARGALSVLESCVVCPPPGQVRSISSGGSAMRGRVLLEEGAGIVLSVSGSDGDFQVLMEAVGAQDPSPCLLPAAIRSINGVAPGPYGGVVLREEDYPSPADGEDGRQLIRVRPGPGGIEISLAELSNAF